MPKRLNKDARAFMEFFEREFGVKFVDEETGEEIKVDENNF